MVNAGVQPTRNVFTIKPKLDISVKYIFDQFL